MKKIILLIFITIQINFIAYSSNFDTLKIYKIGEIEILNDKIGQEKLINPSVVNIPYYVIQSSDVISLSDLQHFVPSGVIRTNSRGESMLFLRGAGERQLGLFLDGASINVPWDNRLDLTFVLIDIIGNIRVNKLGNSMFYGPNVLGGAVSLTTIERANNGYGLMLKATIGDGNTQSYSIINDGKSGNFNYLANLSYSRSDGFLMSGNAPDSLGNQLSNSALRTNTDYNRFNAYLRGEYSFMNIGKIGLSFNYTKQEKGVAPETFAGSLARFWRYPQRDRLIVNLNGQISLINNLDLKVNLWYDDFSQQIDSYKSFEYKEIVESQYDKDFVVGSRLSLIYQLLDNQYLSFVFNGFTTEHKQHINNKPDDIYSQNTYSPGLEYRGLIGNFDINIGLGYDYNITPKTGLFKEAENTKQKDFSAFAILKYDFTEYLSIYLSGSRRTRFPSMREQYDGALGSFKTNPDLEPEKGVLTELGANIIGRNIEANFSVFYNNYTDLIERIRLSKEQDSLRRRMRVNYSEATISGVDLSLYYSPIQNSDIHAFFTYMNIKAKTGGKEVEHLVQKPDIVAGLSANYKFDFGLKPQLELEFVGKQYDSDPEDGTKFVEIDPSLLLNLRLSHSILLGNTYLTELFVRVNNLTDEYKLSQWGLPMAGRTFYAGIMFKI